MHKNDFLPFIFFPYHSFSLSYLELQIIFPCRDIGPATATLDPRPATFSQTPHALTAYHLFSGSCFDATLTTGMARGTDTLWLSSELFFTRHFPEFIGNMQTPTTTRAFVGYLSFFRGKVRVSRFTQKRFGSKNVLKPTLGMKQQIFPRNELKDNNNKKKQFTQWINGWNRINSYRILA